MKPFRLLLLVSSLIATPTMVWAACSSTWSITDSASTSHTSGSVSDPSGNCALESAILGGAGARMDVAIGGATAPTNALVAGGVYNSSLPSLTTGQAAAIQLDSSGREIVTGALGTVGGWTPGVQTALSTTVQSIKSSAGQLGKMLCYNPNSSVAYIQIFNIASGSVTLGSSVAVDVVPVPATLNGGYTLPFPGEQFSTAISFAATTTATGSTAPGTALTCSYGYN